MASSALPSSSSPAALPRWVKEMLVLVPKTSTCVVSVSRGEFVVKVQPATPRHAPLHQDQQRKAHPPQRDQREGGEPQTRSVNARRLRSAQRAKKHAASRRSNRLHLQQLLHRHLWRVRGWQRMQQVWTEWGRTTAPPPPLPAPPQPRPLLIVDPTSFPALSSAPAPMEIVSTRGTRKRGKDPPPPSTPAASTTQLVPLRVHPVWTKRHKSPGRSTAPSLIDKSQS